MVAGGKGVDPNLRLTNPLQILPHKLVNGPPAKHARPADLCIVCTCSEDKWYYMLVVHKGVMKEIKRQSDASQPQIT